MRVLRLQMMPQAAQGFRTAGRPLSHGLKCRLAWGGSSAGRASRSQCEGREFDPPPLHHPTRLGAAPGVPRNPKSPGETTLTVFFIVPCRPTEFGRDSYSREAVA